MTKQPRHQPPSYSSQFYSTLVSSLSDPDFIAQHRNQPADFTRNAVFTFPCVVGILLTTLQRSLQVELDQFFAHWPLPDGRLAHDDAFRMARKKLKPSVCVDLNQRLLAQAPAVASRWHGWRVLAADSTTLYLPSTHPDTIAAAHFNHYHDAAGGIYSLARAAALLDVASGVFLRADLASDSVGERAMLVAQLSAMQPDDLLVLDRGYPAHWLFALLGQQQRAFCIRLPLTYSPQVAAFVRSAQDSTVITCRPQAHHAGFAEHELPLTPFRLRLVRVVLPSGQLEVLATSLLDEGQYPAAVFGQLYQQRWRIEEAFRHIKCRLKLERFGGETPLAIRQEFHATILLHNLATLAGLEALQSLPEAERGKTHINLTHASQLLRLLIPRLLGKSSDIAALCAGLVEGVLCQLTRKRPDRIALPRKRNRAKPRYHRAYK